MQEIDTYTEKKCLTSDCREKKQHRVIPLHGAPCAIRIYSMKTYEFHLQSDGLSKISKEPQSHSLASFGIPACRVLLKVLADLNGCSL